MAGIEERNKGRGRKGKMEFKGGNERQPENVLVVTTVETSAICCHKEEIDS